MTNSYPPGKSYLLQIVQALTHGTPVDYMDVASSENDGPVQNNPDTGRYGIREEQHSPKWL